MRGRNDGIATNRLTAGILAGTVLAIPAITLGQSPLQDPFPRILQLDSLDGRAGFRIAGERAEDRLGQAVAPAGDVNNDGIGDLVIGASAADPGGVDQAGSVYVVFGRDAAAAGGGFPAMPSLADLDGTNGFRIDGVTEFGTLGTSAAGAGDLNGDGIDDVIIGTPNDRPGGATWAGSCYVVYGQDTGAGGSFPAQMTSDDLDGTNGFRIDGTSAFDFAGTSVAPAGDVNNDGIADVVISAFRASPGGRTEAGSTYVLFGRRSMTGPAFPATVRLADLDGATGFRMDGERATDKSGGWVSGAGDLNHDGLDDIILGAMRASPGGRPEAGSAYVVYGRDGSAGPVFAPVMQLADLDGTSGFRIDGVAEYDLLGASVAHAGDANHDGVDDVIVGAPSTTVAGRERVGSAYVLFGRDAASAGPFPAVIGVATLDGTDGFRIDGVDPVDFAGWSVAGAGDVNSDGIGDVIIGALQADPAGEEWAGRAYVVYGRDTAGGASFPAAIAVDDLERTTGFQLDGVGEWAQGGSAVSPAGDLNADGMADVVIAARHTDDGTRERIGTVYIVYGRDPVNCPPDLNGDGALDVADFLAFQNLFDAGDPAADFDRDGDLTFFDFLAFQNAFHAGCG